MQQHRAGYRRVNQLEYCYWSDCIVHDNAGSDIPDPRKSVDPSPEPITPLYILQWPRSRALSLSRPWHAGHVQHNKSGLVMDRTLAVPIMVNTRAGQLATREIGNCQSGSLTDWLAGSARPLTTHWYIDHYYPRTRIPMQGWFIFSIWNKLNSASVNCKRH